MSAKIIAIHPAAESLGNIVNRLIVKPLAARRARRVAFDELMALDDHMLADIGITRGQIPGIISGAVLPRRADNENKPTVAA